MRQLLFALLASATIATLRLQAETRALLLFSGNPQKLFDATSSDRIAIVLYGIPESDLTVLGLGLTCPAGWTYDGGGPATDPGSSVGANLNFEPETHPALGASGTLSWSYQTPVSSASSRAFVVYLKHTAACAGYQTFSPQITFRDSTGATKVNGGQTLILEGLLPLAISNQPASRSSTIGSSATFSAGVNDINRTSVVWKKDGATLTGASVATTYGVAPGTTNVTSATYTLTIPNVSAADAGSYTLVATRNAGEFSATVTSSAGTLMIVAPATNSGSSPATSNASGTASANPSPVAPASGTASAPASSASSPTTPATSAPVITRQPQGQTVTLGTPVTLTVAAAVSNGAGMIVQWTKDGLPISGATSSTLTVPASSLGEAGSYAAIISNSAGSVTSEVAKVSILYAQLINLSAYASVAGGEELIVGYAVAGTSTRTLALRGVGPSLSRFGVTGFMSQPRLTLRDGGGHLVATADTANDSASLNSTFARLGAFPLGTPSGDVALIRQSGPGNFSALLEASARSGGIALAEVYDADAVTGSGRLSNLSARARVGSGASVLIAGFVLAGNTSRAFLLRAIGPTLSAFGITSPLARPVLTVFDARGNTIASNSGWNSDATQVAALNSAMQRAGAFPLAASPGLDAAMVLTLAPGGYTAQVSGLDGGTGLALFELYELP